MNRLLRFASAVLIAFAIPFAAHAEEDPHAAHKALPGSAPAADHSIYQIPGTWTDQDDKPFELASLRGNPVLLVLFYGTCDSVCPILMRDVKKIEALLPETDRARIRVVGVTFDPRVDTPARLLEYAEKNQLDPARWKLLNGASDQVRVLANVLGVQYRPTGTGQFSHTIRISVLDRDGVVVEHSDGLERPLEPIAARVSSLLASETPASP
jgi:protein SCO1/2